MRARPQRPRRAAPLLRLLGEQGGAAAVEFAFTAPMAILLTVGAMEVGRAVWAHASIHHAAKETARFAAVRGAASGSPATVANLEAMALQLADLPDARTTADVSLTPDNRPGSTVTVQLQHTFIPLALPFGSTSFNFSSSASMTILR
jgi:Flp pilus assembly protein TadG